MPTEKIYNELKGEHFHKNNPDMMLKFDKPDRAEIDEMNYKKPITSYKDLPQSNIPLEYNYNSGSGEPVTGFNPLHTLDYLEKVKDLPNNSASIKKGEE
tara:strand:- start:2845 stop:3141 length:297 start_codon:yes stop_codon:yes gene_type:complete